MLHFLVFGLFVLAIYGPVQAQAQEPETPKEEESSWFVDGYLDLRYTWQSNQDDNDQDLYQLLSLTFGEAKTRWITGYISGRLAEDLDGFDHPDPFLSIPDSHDRFYSRLNYAYVDIRPEWKFLEMVRLGRQWIEEVPEIVRMDGLRLESPAIERSLRTRLIVYGGIPEHIGESPRSQDRVFGGGLEMRPFDMTRLSAFYTRLKDVYKQDYVDDTSRVSATDDLMNLELRQGLYENQVFFYGAHSFLNGDSRDSKARLSYEAEDGRTGANLNYRILHRTQETLSAELDPYVSVLRVYHPYQELGFDLRRDLTQVLTAELGAAIRRMDKESDKGPYNHDFEKYFLTGILDKWPFEASEVTVIGNLYDADGDRFWELEGSLAHDLTDELDVEVGTGYALYHEDRYTFEERNHVRSYFGRLEYDVIKNVTFRGGFTVEKDDQDTTNRLDLGIQYRF